MTLEHFRNFIALELAFKPGRTIVYGDNAQGKSNLLEAIALFAAARSQRAERERDLINTSTLKDDIPFARLRATFERQGSPLRLEIVLQLTRSEQPASDDSDDAQIQKRLRLNGIAKRSADIVGEAQVVLFEPQDIELVYGPPSSRRRHLDLALAQIDRSLLRELQRYNRIVAQRNALLKTIREGRARTIELDYWDEQLVSAGSSIMISRSEALRDLRPLARVVHQGLTAGKEELVVSYLPSVPLPERPTSDDVRKRFHAALAQARERELLAAVTLAGPHRDDLGLTVNGANLAAFGSRGQHRLATLSLKLAEAQLMSQRSQRQPVLLLDDILSELDPPRRAYLLGAMSNYEQTIITTADPKALDPRFFADATHIRLVQGRVVAAA